MGEGKQIQWFPGHMAKTRRIMRENLKYVDIVIEIRDARIPKSSSNPEINSLLSNKPRVIILNKADNADRNITKKWIEYYKSKGITAIEADCRSGKGLNGLMPAVKESLKELLERRAQRGMEGMSIRMMVVGIPNVGKSSFINRLAKSRRAKVEDRPGVTRGKQWVTIDGGIELLDMPGVLWPKFEDKQVGEFLAFTGAVKDDILDVEYLAVKLLDVLRERYFDRLSARYGIDVESTQHLDSYDLLGEIGRKRGMLMAGGVVNTERMANTLLNEFRSGAMGNMSLETPND